MQTEPLSVRQRHAQRQAKEADQRIRTARHTIGQMLTHYFGDRARESFVAEAGSPVEHTVRQLNALAQGLAGRSELAALAMQQLALSFPAVMALLDGQRAGRVEIPRGDASPLVVIVRQGPGCAWTVAAVDDTDLLFEREYTTNATTPEHELSPEHAHAVAFQLAAALARTMISPLWLTTTN